MKSISNIHETTRYTLLVCLLHQFLYSWHTFPSSNTTSKFPETDRYTAHALRINEANSPEKYLNFLITHFIKLQDAKLDGKYNYPYWVDSTLSGNRKLACRSDNVLWNIELSVWRWNLLLPALLSFPFVEGTLAIYNKVRSISC